MARKNALKLYIYDRGWEGAEIFVAKSKDEVVEKIRQSQIPYLEESERKHNKPHEANPWTRALERMRSDEFFDRIEEHAIFDGLYTWTEGDC